MTRSAALALTVLALSAAATLTADPAAAKACTNGVCASSTDDGRTVNVYLSTQLIGVTHYNVRRNGSQFESKGFFNFQARKGFKQSYHVQACRRGGFLQKSTCTPWANFHHTTD